MGSVRQMTSSGWADGTDPEHADYNSFAVSDPDGNLWVWQERGYRS